MHFETGITSTLDSWTGHVGSGYFSVYFVRYYSTKERTLLQVLMPSDGDKQCSLYISLDTLPRAVDLRQHFSHLGFEVGLLDQCAPVANRMNTHL